MVAASCLLFSEQGLTLSNNECLNEMCKCKRKKLVFKSETINLNFHVNHVTFL